MCYHHEKEKQMEEKEEQESTAVETEQSHQRNYARIFLFLFDRFKYSSAALDHISSILFLSISDKSIWIYLYKELQI